MEYSVKKGISLSTLRRYIKSNKVAHRIENGRYLLLDEQAEAEQKKDYVLTGSMGHLNAQLQKAQEEIAELKTLIAFYEESLIPRRDV